jgi:hypothetical protein
MHRTVVLLTYSNLEYSTSKKLLLLDPRDVTACA